MPRLTCLTRSRRHRLRLAARAASGYLHRQGLLVQGMEYLHSKKIVHFDLKSANLLLGHKDRRTICKVADFGLSKQKMDTYVSGVSSQRGTLPWIAPEIIRNPAAVDELVPPPAQRPGAAAPAAACRTALHCRPLQLLLCACKHAALRWLPAAASYPAPPPAGLHAPPPPCSAARSAGAPGRVPCCRRWMCTLLA